MNKIIKNIQVQVLSKVFKPLSKVSFSRYMKDKKWQYQTREVYDNGDAATILLYNTTTQKVILTRQFRIPTYLKHNTDGMLIETCAGKLDDDTPQACIIREVKEETGYEIKEVQKIFEAFMSPASITERIHFFVAPYTDAMKVSAGGGLKEEGEEIEVLEMTYTEAIQLLDNGNINDAKNHHLITISETESCGFIMSIIFAYELNILCESSCLLCGSLWYNRAIELFHKDPPRK